MVSVPSTAAGDICPRRRVNAVSDPLSPPTNERAAADQRPLGLPLLGEAPHHLLQQAPVAPMDVDGFRVTILGLIAFGIGSVVTAVFYDQLHRDDNGWWLGVCISGFGLGLVGLAYCLFRRARRRAGRWDRD